MRTAFIFRGPDFGLKSMDVDVVPEVRDGCGDVVI